MMEPTKFVCSDCRSFYDCIWNACIYCLSTRRVPVVMSARCMKRHALAVNDYRLAGLACVRCEAVRNRLNRMVAYRLAREKAGRRAARMVQEARKAVRREVVSGLGHDDDLQSSEITEVEMYWSMVRSAKWREVMRPGWAS